MNQPFFTARATLGLAITSMVAWPILLLLNDARGSDTDTGTALAGAISLTAAIWLVSLGLAWIGGIKVALRLKSRNWFLAALMLAPLGSALAAWRELKNS